MSDSAAAIVSTRLASGRPALALVAKRAYRLSGSALVPAPGECVLRRNPERRISENPGGMDFLLHDSDLFSAAKPLCDVILLGSAHVPRGTAPMLDTGVKIGAHRKVVRVWGERSLRVDASGQLRFSAPEPFSSIPLTWSNAYGGRDLGAEKRLAHRKPSFTTARDAGAVAYPRNPVGRGFHLDWDRERLDGLRAPNLEDPEDPVTPERLLATGPLDWLDRPLAASYGSLDPLTFPRAAFFLAPAFERPARAVREVERGILRAEDLAGADPLGGKFDARAAQSASAGLSIPLRGKARLSLWNVCAGREMVEMDLPPEVPELIVEPAGCRAASVAPLLKTIEIEPDEGRVTFTWSGALEVATAFPREACERVRHEVRWLR